jgi:hypothetical protein
MCVPGIVASIALVSCSKLYMNLFFYRYKTFLIFSSFKLLCQSVKTLAKAKEATKN